MEHRAARVLFCFAFCTADALYRVYYLCVGGGALSPPGSRPAPSSVSVRRAVRCAPFSVGLSSYCTVFSLFSHLFLFSLFYIITRVAHPTFLSFSLHFSQRECDSLFYFQRELHSSRVLARAHTDIPLLMSVCFPPLQSFSRNPARPPTHELRCAKACRDVPDGGRAAVRWAWCCCSQARLAQAAAWAQMR